MSPPPPNDRFMIVARLAGEAFGGLLLGLCLAALTVLLLVPLDQPAAVGRDGLAHAALLSLAGFFLGVPGGIALAGRLIGSPGSFGGALLGGLLGGGLVALLTIPTGIALSLPGIVFLFALASLLPALLGYHWRQARTRRWDG